MVRFRRVVSTAVAELEARRSEVNDLNVFPVADGDTGDNMALTMRAVLDELDRIDGHPLDEIGRGAAEELASRPGELVDPVLVSAAFARAADAAYASVRDPTEGTMLSAVR